MLDLKALSLPESYYTLQTIALLIFLFGIIFLFMVIVDMVKLYKRIKKRNETTSSKEIRLLLVFTALSFFLIVLSIVFIIISFVIGVRVLAAVSY